MTDEQTDIIDDMIVAWGIQPRFHVSFIKDCERLLATRGGTITVDIGAAFQALVDSPDLAETMTKMVGGPALADATAEIEQLNKRIEVLDDVNSMHQRHMGSGEYVTRVALDSLWKMLGATNQTEASMKLKDLLHSVQVYRGYDS